MPRVRIKRTRRINDHIRQNWKFASGIAVLCAVVALGTAIATQGLEQLMSKATLAAKALSDPSKLSAEEKGKLKQMIKEKGGKGAFENLSEEQKKQARAVVGGMSEEDKARYKKMMGK
jgi:hypothetical protein